MQYSSDEEVQKIKVKPTADNKASDTELPEEEAYVTGISLRNSIRKGQIHLSSSSEDSAAD